MIVQVLVADNIGGDVARRVRVFIATVTIGRPAIKLVFAIAVAFGVGTQLIDATKGYKIICVYGVSRASARNFTLAAADANSRRVTRLVHDDPVEAGP